MVRNDPLVDAVEQRHPGLIAGVVISFVCLFAPVLIGMFYMSGRLAGLFLHLPGSWARPFSETMRALIRLPWMVLAAGSFVGGFSSVYIAPPEVSE